MEDAIEPSHEGTIMDSCLDIQSKKHAMSEGLSDWRFRYAYDTHVAQV